MNYRETNFAVAKAGGGVEKKNGIRYARDDILIVIYYSGIIIIITLRVSIMFINKKDVLLGWLIVVILPVLWPFVIYDNLRMRMLIKKTEKYKQEHKEEGLFDWVKNVQ